MTSNSYSDSEPTSPGLPEAGLSDSELAVALVEGAGVVLRGLRSMVVNRQIREFSTDGLKKAGDSAAQEWLSRALRASRPRDAVLSEEAPDSLQRLSADRVWIVDPLDGTREFAERKGNGQWRDDFAVHVALWIRHRGLVLGAVGLPARDRIISSAAPPKAVDVSSNRTKLRIAVSRTRPPDFIGRWGDEGLVEPVAMGSAGVKIMSVLDGTADAYVHAGGQYEWDSAAPVAIAQAAGLYCSRLDGSALEYNSVDPLLPDLLVSRQDDVSHIRELLARVNVDGLTK